MRRYWRYGVGAVAGVGVSLAALYGWPGAVLAVSLALSAVTLLERRFDSARINNETVSLRERATRIVLAGVGLGLFISMLHGSVWTLSLLWESAFWVGLFAVLALLDSLLERRRKAKRL